MMRGNQIGARGAANNHKMAPLALSFSKKEDV